MTAMKEHLKMRMKEGEEAEVAGKAKADEDAATFLKAHKPHTCTPAVVSSGCTPALVCKHPAARSRVARVY